MLLVRASSIGLSIGGTPGGGLAGLAGSAPDSCAAVRMDWPEEAELPASELPDGGLAVVLSGAADDGALLGEPPDCGGFVVALSDEATDEPPAEAEPELAGVVEFAGFVELDAEGGSFGPAAGDFWHSQTIDSLEFVEFLESSKRERGSKRKRKSRWSCG